ncbi:hypothetical protein JW930_07070 [Candidatus Woesearchaeota archaeon]|nr:hypothetical protein [Candidatus Woesearchaeota archaeon]
MRNKNNHLNIVFLVLIVLATLVLAIEPEGATILYNVSETKNASPAGYVNTSGGTFTTLVLYAETQNPRWKAYAGNVTGLLTLDDANNYTIYRWTDVDITGEVYTSRSSDIDWMDINCSSYSNITYEEGQLNHTTTSADSINSTFMYKIHKSFYVGEVFIKNSTCRSTVTWVNNTEQTIAENSLFQEILLSDGNNLVYATPVENNVIGFNNKTYDFQMIVAENTDFNMPNTVYYFYVELV